MDELNRKKIKVYNLEEHPIEKWIVLITFVHFILVNKYFQLNMYQVNNNSTN